MTLFSRFLGFYLKLPVVKSHKVKVIEDLEIPTKDGFMLLTDHYIPVKVKDPPLVLIRTPYGRKSFFGVLYGRLVAERGYQVLIQSCRGTFGSGGEFFPYKFEQEDGLATIEWFKNQDWYPGSFMTIGPSYMGFTQWAIATVAGPDLKAITPCITASEFHSMAYPNNSFSFQSRLDWVIGILTQETGSRFQRSKYGSKLEQAYNYLPLKDIPQVFFEKQAPYWETFLDQGKNFELWDSIGIHKALSRVKIPISMSTGWYDIFLPWQLKDYETLCKNGNKPDLTIGPWAHSQLPGLGNGIRQSINFFNEQMKNENKTQRTASVKLFIMGAKIWQEFQEYPPQNIQNEDWFLQPNEELSLNPPANDCTESYTYDPANPTPNIGGTLLMNNAGPKNNSKLEKRDDVLVYSSATLDEDITIIGKVKTTLYVRSSLKNADFFVRLCDVNPKGTSTNICDNIFRLQSNEELLSESGIKIEFELWPTAYQFKKNHKIRIQVSSGAHPRFIRNLGTNEPLATGVNMIKAEQTIFFGPEHLSHINLPKLQLE